MNGKYHSMIEEIKALHESIREGYVLSPVVLSSQKNSYRGLGKKVKDASVRIEIEVKLERSNLTKKGRFCEFIVMMLKQSISDNWNEDWSWYAAKDYYEEQMRKINPNFISDVARPRKVTKEYIQNIANIKKMIKTFDFIHFMQMLYFALNDPQYLYSYKFFNQDFKLWKMNKEDKLRKIKGIMDSTNYWSGDELSIANMETLINSDELKKEKEMHMIAQLSPCKREELLKLEAEAELAEEEYQSINSQLYHLEDELFFKEKLIKVYKRTISYGKTKEYALNHLKPYNNGNLADPSQLMNEIEDLKEEINEKELNQKEADNIIQKLITFKQDNHIPIN